MLEGSATLETCTSEDEITIAKKYLQFGQLLNDDMEKGITTVDKDFSQILGLEYHRLTYGVYDIEVYTSLPIKLLTLNNITSFKNMC